MTIYLKAKNFRALDKKGFVIENIYPAYRSGGLEVGGKFVGKSFYSFPVEGTDKTEFKEKIWDKEAREFRFVKYEGKLDKEFFTTYKKVFDVEISLLDGIEVPVWDKEVYNKAISDGLSEKEAKKVAEVPTFIAIGDKVVFQAIAASKIKTLMEDMELDDGVELVEGKDKAGNPSKVKPFDWEDNLIPLAIGQKVELKVRGEGMDTKYSFKPSTKKVEKKEEEIKVEDIPFR